MAAELKKAFGAKSILIGGDKGIFDVIVDGKTVFSKFRMGRFPNPGEIVNAIKGT